MTIIKDGFLVRYGYLSEIYVQPGQHLQPAVAWGGKITPAHKLGKIGKTGEALARQLYIDIHEVRIPDDWVYEPPIMVGSPAQVEMNWTVDNTLFESRLVIQKAYSQAEPFMLVSPGSYIDDEIYWNRSFAGRVLYTGYDRKFGNSIVVLYQTSRMKTYKKGPTEAEFMKKETEGTVPEPTVPGSGGSVNVPITTSQDLIKSALPRVNGHLYQMKNKSPVKSTFGQLSQFNGGVRWLKIHPDNFGIVDSFGATVQSTGYAGMNGTFFGRELGGRHYSVNILVLGNEFKRYHSANYDPRRIKETVLCRYKDGSFGLERVLTAQELYFNNNMNNPSRVLWAIGGISVVGPYGYNPTQEGYGVAQTYKTNHTTMGVGKDGFIYLIRSYNVDRNHTPAHMRHFGCEIAIGLDGGGSTSYVVPDANQSKPSTRPVPNMLIATDLRI